MMMTPVIARSIKSANAAETGKRKGSGNSFDKSVKEIDENQSFEAKYPIINCQYHIVLNYPGKMVMYQIFFRRIMSLPNNIPAKTIDSRSIEPVFH